MNQSEHITALCEALSKAQGAFPGVRKTGKNPHRNSEYATLDDVITAIREPLAANGLSFVQPLRSDDDGVYLLETRIMHTSGEWISSHLAIPEFEANRGMNGLQAFGAALTYVRRYALTSMLGINAETDNDGNGKEVHKGNGNGQATKDEKPPHWIKDPKVRKRFWTWAGEQTLSREQVHEALGVDHVEEYKGTMQEAKAQLEAWLTKQIEAEPVSFEQAVEDLYPNAGENTVPAGAQ